MKKYLCLTLMASSFLCARNASSAVEELKKSLTELVDQQPEFYIRLIQTAEEKMQEKMQEKSNLMIQNNLNDINDVAIKFNSGFQKDLGKVIVFVDLKCPFCSRFIGELNTLGSKIKNEILLVPVLILGQDSLVFAEKAHAYSAQNTEKTMQLFSERYNSLADLDLAAKKLTLDTDQATKDSKLKNYKAIIERATGLVQMFGINGVPKIVYVKDDEVKSLFPAEAEAFFAQLSDVENKAKSTTSGDVNKVSNKEKEDPSKANAASASKDTAAEKPLPGIISANAGDDLEKTNKNNVNSKNEPNKNPDNGKLTPDSAPVAAKSQGNNNSNQGSGIASNTPVVKAADSTEQSLQELQNLMNNTESGNQPGQAPMVAAAA